MPLSFPASPTHNQTVTLGGQIYQYNATKGVWEAIGGSGSFIPLAFDTHLLPTDNETYDIGSAEKKIRHLFLSDNTLNIGSQSISADSEGIVMPAVTIGTGTNKVVLSATAEGGLKQAGINSSGVAAPITTGGGVGGTPAGDATTVVDMDALIALTGMTTGQIAQVTTLNRIFMYTGTGWFKIADMQNASPTDITGVAGTYALATDGTATVVTVASTDPEGFPLTFSHSVTAGSLGSTATVSQVDNVFTVTPSSTEADAGSFSITFSVTDGATGAVNAVSAFTLAFWSGDIANASYDSVSFNVNSQDSGPTSIWFNPTGTKMYIMGYATDTVHQYSLSTGFDLSTASYDSVSFSVSGQDTSPRDIWFNPTGTKMYMMGGTNDSVYQYSLSTGFDISTASYDSVSFSVTSQAPEPYGFAFNPTGTKMYMVGAANDSVYQYSV